MTDWNPAVGDWVVYRPHPNAPPEDGEVTGLINPGMVLVRYGGDRYSKATYVEDLTLGTPK